LVAVSGEGLMLSQLTAESRKERVHMEMEKKGATIALPFL
jgi:hypothetical protein